MKMIEIRTNWIHDITYDMEGFLPIIAVGIALIVWGVGTLYSGSKS